MVIKVALRVRLAGHQLLEELARMLKASKVIVKSRASFQTMMAGLFTASTVKRGDTMYTCKWQTKKSKIPIRQSST